MDDLIPCEFCAECIHFDDYETHVQYHLTLPPPAVNLPQTFVVRDDENRMIEIRLDANMMALMQQRINAAAARDVLRVEDDGGGDDGSDDDGDSEDGDEDGDGEGGDEDGGATVAAAQQPNNPFSQMVYTLIAFENPELIDMNDYEFNTLLAQQIGNVEIGVSDIKTVTSIVPESERILLKESVCAICQERFEQITSDTELLKTLCNHIYCSPCIAKWLSSSKKCPVCIIDLEDEAIKN